VSCFGYPLGLTRLDMSGGGRYSNQNLNEGEKAEKKKEENLRAWEFSSKPFDERDDRTRPEGEEREDRLRRR
jgi:hypothetical protein